MTKTATEHHTHAADHHEQGDHPAAAEHALLAHGHTVQASNHADAAATLHANLERSTAHSHG